MSALISPGDPALTPGQVRELQDALSACDWRHKMLVLPPRSRVCSYCRANLPVAGVNCRNCGAPQ